MTRIKHDWKEADALTDAEIHAAALADPDAQPLTRERLARMRRVPCTTSLRRALGLSQEEFAARYHIPVSTLHSREYTARLETRPLRAGRCRVRLPHGHCARARDRASRPGTDAMNIQSLPGFYAEPFAARGRWTRPGAQGGRPQGSPYSTTPRSFQIG
jgi:putative transcriptional regulator